MSILGLASPNESRNIPGHFQDFASLSIEPYMLPRCSQDKAFRKCFTNHSVMSTTESLLNNAVCLVLRESRSCSSTFLGPWLELQLRNRSGPVWLGGHHPSALNENRFASLQRRYSDVEGALPGRRSLSACGARKRLKKLLKGRYNLFNQEGVPNFHAFNS